MLTENLIAESLGFEVLDISTVSSQSLWAVSRVETNEGVFCIKYGDSPPPGLFFYEAAGLREIRRTREIAVPAIVHVSENMLVMPWIDGVEPDGESWEIFGASLAHMHKYHNDCFGFSMNGYCGAGKQDNSWRQDGCEFFAACRIEPQLRWARDQNYLAPDEARKITALVERFEQLIPAQPASLVHGDLWRGNLLFSSKGAELIDPAIHYGWAEADLAMSCLFGRFDPVFYQSYFETRPLESGFNERIDLYNIYHLLNHLNIFGMSYHRQVMDVVKRF